jgi:hypothetical protein
MKIIREISKDANCSVPAVHLPKNDPSRRGSGAHADPPITNKPPTNDKGNIVAATAVISKDRKLPLETPQFRP